MCVVNFFRNEVECFRVLIAWASSQVGAEQMGCGEQMDLNLEALLRLIELILVCQLPAWTFVLGYILAKH